MSLTKVPLDEPRSSTVMPSATASPAATASVTPMIAASVMSWRMICLWYMIFLSPTFSDMRVTPCSASPERYH